MGFRTGTMTTTRRLRRAGLPGLGPGRSALLFGVIAAGSAAGYLSIARPWSSPANPPMPAPVAIARAQTLAVSTAATGVVDTTRRVNLAAASPGRLATVQVKPGDTVTAGQVIATLDTASLQARRDAAAALLDAARAHLQALTAPADPAMLDAQRQLVAGAQTNLDRAQSDLATLLNGAPPADVATARDNLDQALAMLDSAQRAYDSLAAGDRTQRPEYVALTNAQSAYQAALTAYTNLTSPPQSAIDTAQRAVTSAQARLDAANAGLNALKHPSNADVTAARSAVDAAQARLDAADTALSALLHPSDDRVAAGQNAVAAARSDLDAANAAYAAIYLGGPLADQQAARAAVDQAQARLDALLARAGQGSADSVAVDSSEGAGQAMVQQARADLARAQAELARVQGQQSGPELAAADGKVHDAETRLQIAQTNLDRLLHPATADVTAAQQQVQGGEASLAVARSNLDRLVNPPDADVLAAQQTVDGARAALTAAQGTLDSLTHPDPAGVAQRRAALDTARQTLDTAQAAWDRLVSGDGLATSPEAAALASAKAIVAGARAAYDLRTAPPKPGDVDAARARVDSVRSTLQAAQERLNQITTGPAPAEVDQARQGVTQAELGLKQAQSDLDAATITAPFNGAVTAVAAKEGDFVSPTTAIATLEDPTRLHINATVDQAAIQRVKPGQPATITFDGIPDRTFAGTVSAVVAADEPAAGGARYPVTIDVDGAGEPLQPGMAATIRILTDAAATVVTVPSGAVQLQGQDTTVTVVLADGTAETRSVTVAPSEVNGTTAILSGVNAGERVEVPVPAVATATGTPAAVPATR
jgi:HlyD family secretion protein